MNRMGTVAAVFVATALLAGPSLTIQSRTVFAIGAVNAWAVQKTPANIEAEIDRESNPKKRLSLSVDLMDERLKVLQDAFESQDPDKESEAVENYMTAADRLEKAMNEN